MSPSKAKTTIGILFVLLFLDMLYRVVGGLSQIRWNSANMLGDLETTSKVPKMKQMIEMMSKEKMCNKSDGKC